MLYVIHTHTSLLLLRNGVLITFLIKNDWSSKYISNFIYIKPSRDHLTFLSSGCRRLQNDETVVTSRADRVIHCRILQPPLSWLMVCHPCLPFRRLANCPRRHHLHVIRNYTEMHLPSATRPRYTPSERLTIVTA